MEYNFGEQLLSGQYLIYQTYIYDNVKQLSPTYIYTESRAYVMGKIANEK